MRRHTRKALGFIALGVIFWIVAFTEPYSWMLAYMNLLSPRSGYMLKEDIAYGDLPRQKLDIYIPKDKTGPLKTLIYFYGGYWQQGDRAQYRFIGQSLSKLGYVVVIPDYHIYPESSFPQFLKDTTLAARWAHKNIREYGGNGEAIYLIGHSAGAYNIVMSVLREDLLKSQNKPLPWIRGVIGIAGPYHFRMDNLALEKIFAPAKNYWFTQPVYYSHLPSPPMLLLTGDKDGLVLPYNTQRLTRHLREVKNPVKSIIYADVGHYTILLAMLEGKEDIAPVRADIKAFIEAH